MRSAEHGPKSTGHWIWLMALAAVVGIFVWTEHRAHVARALPYLSYLLFLGCPLLHLFMHRSHGHGTQGAEGQHEQIPPREVQGS